MDNTTCKLLGLKSLELKLISGATGVEEEACMEVVMDRELGETVDKSSVWLLVWGEEPVMEVTTIFSGVIIGTGQVEGERDGDERSVVEDVCNKSG